MISCPKNGTLLVPGKSIDHNMKLNNFLIIKKHAIPQTHINLLEKHFFNFEHNLKL
jgi:hypothetical protein